MLPSLRVGLFAVPRRGASFLRNGSAAAAIPNAFLQPWKNPLSAGKRCGKCPCKVQFSEKCFLRNHRKVRRLHSFAKFGNTGNGGIRRFSVSPAVVQARNEIKQRMTKLGLDFKTDDLGVLTAMEVIGTMVTQKIEHKHPIQWK